MFPEASPNEVEKALKENKNVSVLDVREDVEVAAGKIPSAKHIKMSDIPESLDYFEKEKEYVFICRSGYRSERVCEYLQDQGYKVRNMVGGMLEWSGDVK